ncbi:MAG: branched-chain amino acid aminotransferase [Hyphomicrobiales bacterium]|jgi:branched-chain amino acid aminotransferase|nr:branched-chain amino acid aminotransferase [Hyphomicrobiales bacterium]
MIANFDNRDGYIWFNGKYVDWPDVKLHVLSHALHYASSVFEGERVYNKKIFKLEEHTERLLYSASRMDMVIPYTKEEINDACNSIIQKNSIVDGYVRPIAWRGAEMMGVSAQNTKINFAIAIWEWPSYFDPEERLKGIRLEISRWKRPSPETIPCDTKAAGLYMICTLSKHEAEKKGYADSLMLDYQGNVSEATGANVFFIKDNEIHTPTPDCFLDGITRRTVIGLAKKRGLVVVERKILPSEMLDFTECFLTGTAVEVTPVSEIGDYHFKPGEITKDLMQDYLNLVKN